MEEGVTLPRPLLEFYYKDDKLGDPMVGEDHILAFNWADPYEMEEIVTMAWRINDFLSGLFAGINLRLVDFKLEFGRLWGSNDELYLLLADEISPDGCRIWDMETGEKLDKDRFRFDLGDLVQGYQIIAERLGLIPKGGLIEDGTFNEKLAEGLEEIENELARERRLRSLGKSHPNKPRKF